MKLVIKKIINDKKKFTFSQKLKSSQRIVHINYSYKESFKRENESYLDESAFIENYNNALKSPQSRRLYKIIESEVHTETI